MLRSRDSRPTHDAHSLDLRLGDDALGLELRLPTEVGQS